MKMVTPLLTSLLAVGAWASTSLCANAATPARTFNTSFDCASAREPIEKLICRDSQLAQMDRELQRLYLLALTDAHSVPPPNKVELDQQFWVHARNQCAGTQAKACTIRSYVERAHLLRQGSAIARTKDPSRLTEGPVAYRCTGFNGVLTATFFNAEPGVVYLKWANASVILDQVSNYSGTQYKGKDFRGDYSFWQNGSETLLQMPGSGAMTCTVDPAA
ncbi:MliC family protein [Pseudomonas sp. YuFO8]|uniref:MliC family protein n=1 Tax=Pseudomonas neuropathica TaxID=2730425 RepID=A0ACC7MQD9_9PSED|nr:MliC family protein [Pseudomonas sp. YuFO8]MEB2623161.1 MliC family protein [Pseudomonas sp. YuFO8]